MWTTFITTLKINLRAKSAVFWMFCFPIVLSTMFMGMFGNLDKQYHVEPMRFAVVTDHAFCDATAARQLLRSLERDSMETPACQALPEQTAQAGEASELRDLLVLQPVDTATQAQTLINADPSVHGYVQVDGEGMLRTVISRTTISDAGNATNGASLPISLSILNEVTGTFNRQQLAMGGIVQRDPQILHDPAFLNAIAERHGTTKEVSLTHFRPNENAPYYFALLAMTAIMATSFAITTVCSTQANLSALGMRRSMAPLTKFRQLMAGFLATWVCTIASMLVALLYMRFVCGVAFGGRWAATILAIFVGALASNALGTLIGAIPALATGTKIGLSTALACVCSLFTGLYGSPAMRLSETIQRDAPALAIINPAQQITNLFYDILYYDSYEPFWRTIIILLAMTVLCLAAATAFLRRQRYEHL